MQGKIPSQAEYMKPRLVRRVSVAQSGRYISSKEVSKGSEKKPSKTVNNVLMRSKAEKKTSEAAAQDKCPMHKALKHEVDLTFANAVLNRYSVKSQVFLFSLIYSFLLLLFFYILKDHF